MQTISNSNAGSGRQALFMELYQKGFPAVARYISSMGGSFDEAKDVFQDALIAYYEKVVLSSLVLDNDIAYLFGTARNIWLKRYHQGRQKLPLDQMDVVLPDESLPCNKRLFRFLETAGRKCMSLLKSFYYDQMSLQEIADDFGFSGIRSATVQKYKCLEKIRETVKEKALLYEDFLE